MYDRKKARTLGILGGLGPMATVYFYEMLTEHTRASSDQEHIDIVISSRATTPDRTAFILGTSDENPLEVMKKDAEKLVAFGADLISIPCNTAHYFYDALAASIDVPIVNIIYETVSHIKRTGAEKIGVLATEGTIGSGAYEHMCRQVGIGYEVPDKEYQDIITDIIYNEVKQGKHADRDRFLRVAEHMKKKGCDKLVLGCTELSLIKRDGELDGIFVDSLEVLAHKTILLCGKEPIGFDAEMTADRE